MKCNKLEKLEREMRDIEDAMDATQVGDEDTLMMLGLGDDWNELTEMRNSKEEEIEKIKHGITKQKVFKLRHIKKEVENGKRK